MMLTLNEHVARGIATTVNNERGSVISTFEVQALGDGAKCNTTLKEFVELCHLYVSTGLDPHIQVIAGYAYCTYCGDQITSDRCICLEPKRQ